jgi:two-component sensor histidine kinase
VPTLDDIARFQTTLSTGDVARLHALVTDWQIIADLAFADLVLWLPDAESKGMWAAAQIRPTTGPTTLLEDVVGTFVPTSGSHALDEVMTSGRIAEHDDERLVPVPGESDAMAVLAIREAAGSGRGGGALEATYRQAADDLVQMIHRAEFPLPGPRSDLADSLRVGDGFIRTDASGSVTYASPNALSAYRRLGLSGDLVDSDLADVTSKLVDRRPTDRGARGLLTGTSPGEAEIENAQAFVLLRVIPLQKDGRSDGAVVLLRDVTELRSRERELVSKEATIREIHHRVKNNLQTVAALLRLQGRRMDVPEAREALEEAVRRVGSIAVVHETLSQSFDEQVAFDAIADRLLRTVLDVAGEGVVAERIGTFGSVRGEIATPLAMVLTELIQNAAQHAFPERGGRLTVAVNRIRDRLRLRVTDDGVGLPKDFDVSESLGLSIVSTLVETELGGTLAFEQRPRGGTTVAISLTV